MHRAAVLVLFGLLMLACDQVRQGPTAGPSEARRLCEGRGAVEADVDGDGEPDIVHHVWVESSGAVLAVCTAAGLEDQIDGLGMAEFMTVLDIEPDGRAEIFYGANTVSLGGAHVAVIEGNELRAVVSEDGEPLLLRDGAVSLTDAGDLAESAGWGCLDIDNDEQNELISVSVNFTDRAAWTRIAYRLTGSHAAKIFSDSGFDDLPVERWAFAATLTSPCPPA